MPEGARRLFGLRHRGDPLDVGALAFSLPGREIDLAGLLGALAGEPARDLRELLLAGLPDELDPAVLLGLLEGEGAPHVGELLFARLLDEGDVAVPPAPFDGEVLLDVGRLAPPGLLDDREVAFGPHPLQILLVVDLLVLDRHALVQHVDLLLAHLEGLLVRDLPILLGAGERLLALDLEELELGVEVPLADRHRGPLLGVVHGAARVRGDLGDDLEPFGVEHVVGLEELPPRLLQGDDRDLFQDEAVRAEALGHVRPDLARERIAVLVQLVQGLGRGIAPERAHHLRFEEVADPLRVEGALAEAAGRGEEVLGRVPDVGVELRHHVDPDLVGGEDRLLARPAHHQLERFQRDPGDLVEHREHDGALAEGHLGAEKAGADESHVGRRPLVDPYREHVEDRDDHDGQHDEGDDGFHGSIRVRDLAVTRRGRAIAPRSKRRRSGPASGPPPDPHQAHVSGRAPKSKVGSAPRSRRMRPRRSSVAARSTSFPGPPSTTP